MNDFNEIKTATNTLFCVVSHYANGMFFLKIIDEAAERMANRIAELEQDLVIKEQERLGAMNATNKWYNDYNELKADLAAAKPITFCVDCKYEPTCNCEVMTYAGKEILQNQRHEIAYCSRAVRKEAKSGGK